MRRRCEFRRYHASDTLRKPFSGFAFSAKARKYPICAARQVCSARVSGCFTPANLLPACAIFSACRVQRGNSRDFYWMRAYFLKTFWNSFFPIASLISPIKFSRKWRLWIVSRRWYQNLFFNYQMPQIACNEILACVAIAIFFNRFCSTRIFTCRNGFAVRFRASKNFHGALNELVGTQSNMSIPWLTTITISLGSPIPIKYRGRSFGSRGQVVSKTSCI